MTERRPRDFSKDAKIAALASIVFKIPHDHQKAMHEDHVQSLLDWHHNTPYANGGSNHFSNAVPMLRAAHKERTAKIDVPEIAKGKRLRKREAAHTAVLEVKAGRLDEGGPLPRSKVAFPEPEQRPAVPGQTYWNKKRELQSRWPKGRKMQSRGFERRRS